MARTQADIEADLRAQEPVKHRWDSDQGAVAYTPEEYEAWLQDAVAMTLKSEVITEEEGQDASRRTRARAAVQQLEADAAAMQTATVAELRPMLARTNQTMADLIRYLVK